MSTEATDRLVPLDDQALALYARTLDEAELALLIQQYAAAQAWGEVLELCKSRVDGQRSSRGVRLCEARARFAIGERATALALVQGALDEQPLDTLAAFYKAQFLAQSGQAEAAKVVLRALIELTPDFPGALASLAQLCLPGPPYREVLRRLHEHLRPRTYLEIGVEHGATLQLAVHSQVVVGVDPTPRPSPFRLPRGTQLFDETSDAFFARTRASVLGDLRVDLAFIDGMHWFDFALRDFANVERWCHPGSTVVLHDCLPVAAVAARRIRRTSFWVGDTWKALVALSSERPDLELTLIPCYPSGLVVIRNLDPARPAAPPLGHSLAPDAPDDSQPFAVGQWPEQHATIANTDAGLTELFGRLGPVGGAAR